MLDTVIRGGLVVDGTGAPARPADVGIVDGRIAAVGRVDEPARRTVDADGMVVAPGFIDIHSHYDAQLFWDPTLRPSPLHGVTTVIAGNCGYSLAPVREPDHAWLLGLLSRVEEVPLATLEAAVDLRWSSFADYLAAADRPLGVNAAFYVGHSAVRRAVMGPAASEAVASPEQVAAMAALVDDALRAGAIGFATAFVPQHVDADNRATPPQWAHYDEMRALAAVCGRHPGTVVQITPKSAPPGEAERQLFLDMAKVSGRPVTYLLITSAEQLDLVDEARAQGALLFGQSFFTDGTGARMELGDSLLLRGWPDPWPTVMALPTEEKLQALADPAVRARMLAAAMAAPPTAKGLPSFADRWLHFEVNDVADPKLRPLVGRRIPDLAAERGVDPFDAWLDVTVADRLHAGFTRSTPDPVIAGANRSAMLDPRSLWGAFDSGAHTGSFVGASLPTRILQALVRDGGLLPLETAVHRLTGQLAAWWGVVDRGLLTEGYHADIVLFDPDRIGCGRIQPVTDWPAGAMHLTADATGIDRVLVNGREVAVRGEYTGELPGRVLRSGTDTRTVAPSLA